jgi:hypothetical protein
MSDHTHVSPAEELAANDPDVGAGVAKTAPEVILDDSTSTSVNPTRKWWAARVTGAAAILTMCATTGGWNAEETVALIGLLAEGGVSWLTTNDPAPVIE